MESLPPPPITMAATLALIALALALPWARIGWQGGGRTMMRLFCCSHGLCCWHHLCLRLQDDVTKVDSHGNRQGLHANIRGQEEVGHYNPIGMEHQKQKQKQKQIQIQKQKQSHKQKQKQNQQQWRQCCHFCAWRQLRLCCRRCCLCVSRGSSGGSKRVMVAAAAAKM
jgi:hypothetical protein